MTRHPSILASRALLNTRLIVPIITLAWGTVMTLTGIIHNWSGLMACRFFLGIPESGIFPACAYYVTSWYPRHEAQYRTALFYASASMAYVLAVSLVLGV